MYVTYLFQRIPNADVFPAAAASCKCQIYRVKPCMTTDHPYRAEPHTCVPCGHSFCGGCIVSWFVERVSSSVVAPPSCPLTTSLPCLETPDPRRRQTTHLPRMRLFAPRTPGSPQLHTQGSHRGARGRARGDGRRGVASGDGSGAQAVVRSHVVSTSRTSHAPRPDPELQRVATTQS